VGAGLDDGPLVAAKQRAVDLGINDLCIWYGKIAQQDVQAIMRRVDLLFFPSLFEGTSHVVLESISNDLPVLCFDICGHGEVITNKVGRKIPLSNPAESVALFSEHIRDLFSNRAVLSDMSKYCRIRVDELSWDKKGQQLFSLYKNLSEKAKGEVCQPILGP
jgi:glycosyltransferase involved in cell wall biosynthesis